MALPRLPALLRRIPCWQLTSTRLTLLLAGLFVALYNGAFYRSLAQAENLASALGFFFAISLSVLLLTITSLLLSLFVLPRIAKPILIFILCTAACVAYFMDTYGMVIHTTMVQNTFETDLREVLGLLNAKLLGYFLVLGLMPSILLLRAQLVFGNYKQELLAKLKLWGAGLLAILLSMAPLTAEYASFFRNHKEVRQKANPANVLVVTFNYATRPRKPSVIQPLGEDAQLNGLGRRQAKPTLLVLVLGETARADRFSINGYTRPTTPLIAQQHVINYSQVYSCGTETAVSVPCMFSNLGRADYSDSKAKARENLLDLVKRSHYSVLWRNNNSDCKGVCKRVDYEEMAWLREPGLCNGDGCFDDILLFKLDEKLAAMPAGNKMLVLHQKGSHGPEYFRRYPTSMEVFKPVCKSNDLQTCSDEELNNSFDNSIHYTDYFLNGAIEWLKTKSDQYNTAMVYLSDHGESLGEKNLYLHGMPYLLAPKEQKHVPFFMWFSPGFEQDNHISRSCLLARGAWEYSHDNLFHTTLSLLNINTSLYRPELDLLQGCRTEGRLALQ
jgi:lipid A ethanolaminephosphotransferase